MSFSPILSTYAIFPGLNTHIHEASVWEMHKLHIPTTCGLALLSSCNVEKSTSYRQLGPTLQNFWEHSQGGLGRLTGYQRNTGENELNYFRERANFLLHLIVTSTTQYLPRRCNSPAFQTHYSVNFMPCRCVHWLWPALPCIAVFSGKFSRKSRQTLEVSEMQKEKLTEMVLEKRVYFFMNTVFASFSQHLP